MKRLLLLFILSPLISCHIYSVDINRTSKRNNINFAINQGKIGELDITITNSGFKKLNPIDSLSFIYYQDNANLYSPIADSIRTASSTKIIIDWVYFVNPVAFYNLKYNKIRLNDTITIPASSLTKAVMNEGTPDNKNQLYNRFQIFCKGFYKKKLQFLIPSNYFKIQADF